MPDSIGRRCLNRRKFGRRLLESDAHPEWGVLNADEFAAYTDWLIEEHPDAEATVPLAGVSAGLRCWGFPCR